NRAEVLLHSGERILGIQIAGQRQHRVVRGVIRLEELLDVLHRGRIQIGHRPDHRMLVGEVVVHQLVHLFEGLPVRLVVDAQAPFFFDGLPLILQVRLGDLERPHAVGLQEQGQVELVLGHDFEVQGAVVVGRAVHAAALGEDPIKVLAGPHVFRAFEHHVLEQVGEAGAPLALVARADFITDGDAEYRGIVVLRDDHPETVVERVVGELDWRQFRRGMLGKDQPCRRDQNRQDRFQRDLLIAFTVYPETVYYSAASSFPTSAVRSAMRSTNRLSFAACAPSPTAPKPSSVGIPSAAVKFPSEPPPVSDSSNSTPISLPNSRAFRKSATIPAERSIGGRFNPPVTSMVHRRSKGLSARNFFSSAGASRKHSTRISTSTRASAATTLLRVPPETTPGFTVTPRCNGVKLAIWSICRASSSTALAPASKST